MHPILDIGQTANATCDNMDTWVVLLRRLRLLRCESTKHTKQTRGNDRHVGVVRNRYMSLPLTLLW